MAGDMAPMMKSAGSIRDAGDRLPAARRRAGPECAPPLPRQRRSAVPAMSAVGCFDGEMAQMRRVVHPWMTRERTLRPRAASAFH